MRLSIPTDELEYYSKLYSGVDFQPTERGGIPFEDVNTGDWYRYKSGNGNIFLLYILHKKGDDWVVLRSDWENDGLGTWRSRRGGRPKEEIWLKFGIMTNLGDIGYYSDQDTRLQVDISGIPLQVRTGLRSNNWSGGSWGRGDIGGEGHRWGEVLEGESGYTKISGKKEFFFFNWRDENPLDVEK